MATNNKRKIFGIGGDTNAQIGKDLAAVSSDEGFLDTIPLDRIQLDPENPRRLGLNPKNPREIAEDDPRREWKQGQLELLEDMALSIAKKGVEQPIKVYRFGNGYRIAMGERRYLSSVLAGKAEIPCLVLNQRPRDLRYKQLVENLLRVDLSLCHRLINIRDAMEESRALGQKIDTAEELRRELGLSRTQAFQYWAVMLAPKDVWEAVNDDRFSNLDFAASVARMPDPVLRARAIKEGQLEEVKATAAPAASAASTKRSKGRPAVVKLGNTADTMVIRVIIEKVLGEDTYTTDWTDPKAVSKVWKQFLKDLAERQS